ncbi:non-homologous end-joining DNA ligase [Marinobacter fonticola]|uniref:non-homologous end-joining DNA ligase n=1 Tax=Marinobacter fonticola TaxID=2603215 RepID=UPI0011E7B7D5|nr:non-homologous end-joining DNA ligase [Marinobacter fonticola]
MTERKFGKHTIDLSNQDKVFFPDDKITKGSVVAYYDQVADFMLPHIKGRPLTLHRFPDGIGKSGFFQQNRADHYPGFVDEYAVDHGGNTGQVRHILADHRAALVYLADQGAITLHRWLSQQDHIGNPDTLIFDLDPPGDDFGPVRQAGLWVADAMRELGLTPYVMSTGSKGIHVVAPLRPEADFDRVREIAQGLARWLADEHSDELTTEQRKNKRKGRIYLDVMRNAFGQTAVAPYAIRAKAGAPVAMPLEWDELEDKSITPQSFDLNNATKHLNNRHDPWADMHRHAIKPDNMAKKLEKLLT